MAHHALARLLTSLILVALSTMAAADTASDLLNLHRMRLAAHGSLGNFYMLNAMEGDQRYVSLIAASRQSAADSLARMGEMPGEQSSQLKTRLDSQWQDYAQELESLSGKLSKSGFIDLEPAADLSARNRELLETAEQLYGKIQEESGTQVPPLTQQSREQSLLMQTIAADYVQRNATVGATPSGAEERALEDLANRFAINLVRLQQAEQTTPVIGEALRSVDITWRYLEKTLRDKGSLPLLVHKYSDRIIENLETAAALYAASQS
ncbi:hypothetical protein D3C78_555190 [compost metagenome]